MIRKKRTFQPRQWDGIIANHRIRFPEVRVLSDRGEQLGVMSSQEAMIKAQTAGKDLVLLSEAAKPPVVKIIELAKFKYQKQQKDAESRKKSKKQDLKEVRFTPFMGEADFQSRLKKVVTFLEKGDKVRLSLMFKGRAITKKEFGYDRMNEIIAQTEEISTVEMAPKLMGNKLIAQLMPSK
ncbi:MAG TPA: translation initiation factor IF-3, partial [Patescibacteria group bacterium]